MATVKAIVETKGDHCAICIDPGGEDIKIPLSDDNANQVKRAFNKLILRLKAGDLQIKIENLGDDLLSQVAKEYITQLNREMKEVRAEIKQYSLTDE